MSNAYLNLIGGLSGDMLLSSLIDAGLDPKKLSKELNKISEIDFEISVNKTERQNLKATHIDVVVNDSIKWTWPKLYKAVDSSKLNKIVKERVNNCFDLLKSAEQEAHDDKNPHLHELGTSDTLVDICGFFIGIEILGIDKIYSSPIPVVPGFIKTSHGIHETLAPATKKIVEKLKVPVRYINNSSNIETITPTGMSIIGSFAYFNDSVIINTITKGSGAGTKNFKNFPNILSINIGESREKSLNQEIKCMLETNIDDMTPEHLGRFIDYSISMGALDTWITPYYGKKNRLGHKLSLLCNESDSEKFSNLIIDQTSSLGIRLFRIERLVADREIRNFNSTMGKIKIKLKFHNNELHSVKPEFEDLNRISNETGRSIISINKEIEYEINKDFFS